MTRSYPIGDTTFRALDGVSLDLPRAAFVAVVGRSGSGKSTLVNLLGGLDRPTQGSVEVDGEQLERLDEDALSRWRGKNVYGGAGTAGRIVRILTSISSSHVRITRKLIAY